MNFSLCLAVCVFGIGSDGRRGSVSWTVRICLASASERVKARSHSLVIISHWAIFISRIKYIPGSEQKNGFSRVWLRI